MTPDGTVAGAAARSASRPFDEEPPARAALAARTVIKRTLDVVVSALILLLALPLFAVVALAILVESPGPVLYHAERVGRHGRSFRMLKFRKMRKHASGVRLTTRGDARFTRVGAWLARTKLDELPQFVNVLRGDMSLIGPRPEDPGFVARRSEDYEVILRVRPGVTGLAQLAFAEESRILCLRDPVTHYLDAIFPQKCRLDRLYVRSPSLRTDLRIVLWTLVAIIVRRPVAVDRATGRMTFRRGRVRAAAPARRAGDEWSGAAQPVAAATASTTSCCCGSLMCANSGSVTQRSAYSSVSGST